LNSSWSRKGKYPSEKKSSQEEKGHYRLSVKTSFIFFKIFFGQKFRLIGKKESLFAVQSNLCVQFIITSSVNKRKERKNEREGGREEERRKENKREKERKMREGKSEIKEGKNRETGRESNRDRKNTS
jgi:hypothetical protein